MRRIEVAKTLENDSAKALQPLSCGSKQSLLKQSWTLAESWRADPLYSTSNPAYQAAIPHRDATLECGYEANVFATIDRPGVRRSLIWFCLWSASMSTERLVHALPKRAKIVQIRCLLLVALACLHTAMFAADVALSPIADDAFTIVIMPDTQTYRGPGTKIQRRGLPMHEGMAEHPYVQAHWQRLGERSPAKVDNVYLAKHIDWLLENRTLQNIVFVSHVGDIVDTNRPEEWSVAQKHFDRLRGLLPFAFSVGNHDMQTDGDASLFQNAFPASSFEDDPWYYASYEHDRPDQSVSADNVNSVQRFSAGGIDFVFLHLECNAPDDVVRWADEMLHENADRFAMITTHMDLGIVDKPTAERGYIHDPKGRMRWVKRHKGRGNNAEQLWDKLYRKHANLRFVFSGDQSRVTTHRQTLTGDAGNTVHALLSDYQSFGALRLMRFHPKRGTVEVVTYDTMLDALVESTPYSPKRSDHQFTLRVDVDVDSKSQ